MGARLRFLLLLPLLVLSQLAVAQVAPVQSLVAGWNLIGNDSSASIDPNTLFGNGTAPVTGVSDQIVTVWKWEAASAKWMFFAPSMTVAELATYASSKSYGVLSSIGSGEGFWVNSKSAMSITLPSGAAADTAPSHTLVQGWNLVANNTAAALNPVALFGDKTTPVSGVSTLISTVWKWNAATANWMFFAPSLDATGLATYAAGKSYGVLSSILPGDGYWVNAGSATTLALPPTLSGVAALGGPLSDAAVTLVCGDGTSNSTTADADGAYAFGLSNCAGPYALRATGTIGEVETSLVSLLAEPPSPGSNLVVNATPITDAIAATVAGSGIPYDLVGNFDTEKVNITSTVVATAEAAFRAVLNEVLSKAGASSSDNLISTRFKADGTSAMDMVLDRINVDVQPNGQIQMYTAQGMAVDDLGDFSTPPAPGSVLTLDKGVLPQASQADLLPAAPSGSEMATSVAHRGVRKALENCFAVPSTERGTYAALGGACASLPLKALDSLGGQYVHDGKDGGNEFDPWLRDATMDGARFLEPTILRHLSDSRAKVDFVYEKTDGFAGNFTTIVENVDNVWTMVGNQRTFRLLVNGFTKKVINLSGTSPSRYETGIQLFVRYKPTVFHDTDIASAQVFGPGLPGYVDSSNMGTGVALVVRSGCDHLSLNPTTCGSLFRFRSTKISDGTAFTSGQNPEYFASPQLTDVEISAIKPQSLYKFEITKTDSSKVTYWSRLRARALTTAEAAKVKYLAFSDESKALLTSYAGGAPPTITWTKPERTRPAFKAAFGHNAYSDGVKVKLSDRSATIKCTSNSDCDGSGGYKSLTRASGDSFQLISRNRRDLEIFSQISYSSGASQGTNAPPTANIVAPQNVIQGATVTLDGSGSSDTNGDTITYAWTITAKPTNSTAILSSASALTPTFTADVAGDYVVSLTVNDGTSDSTASSFTITAAGQSASTTVAATVVDPYIEGAVFCVDSNRNKACDAGEPRSSPSTAAGSISFDLTGPLPADSLIVADTASLGTHNGAAFALPMSALVAQGADNFIISPMTTIRGASVSVSTGQLDALTNQDIADLLSTAGLAGINASDITADPMRNIDSLSGTITDADLVRIRAALSAYGYMRLFNASNALHALTPLEIKTSGSLNGGPVYEILSTMVGAIKAVVSPGLVAQAQGAIDSANVQLAAASMALPAVTAEVIVKAGVAILDRVVGDATAACNASGGDHTAGLQKANQLLNSTGFSQMVGELGLSYYGAHNKTALQPAYTAGYLAASPTLVKGITCTSRHFSVASELTTQCAN